MNDIIPHRVNCYGSESVVNNISLLLFGEMFGLFWPKVNCYNTDFTLISYYSHHIWPHTQVLFVDLVHLFFNTISFANTQICLLICHSFSQVFHFVDVHFLSLIQATLLDHLKRTVISLISNQNVQICLSIHFASKNRILSIVFSSMFFFFLFFQRFIHRIFALRLISIHFSLFASQPEIPPGNVKKFLVSNNLLCMWKRTYYRVLFSCFEDFGFDDAQQNSTYIIQCTVLTEFSIRFERCF